MPTTNVNVKKINIEKPRWDQSSFGGRFKHFAAVTDTKKAFASNRRLNAAQEMVKAHRAGRTPPGTTVEQLWYSKQLYDSAFHPDTGKKMNLLGRMSFQVPGGMAVTALMLQFYKTPIAVASTQWVNQSFNALVNATNSGGDAPVSKSAMFRTYVIATSTALAVALGLNFAARGASPIVARLVPFGAVAGANAINIPFSRNGELRNGISVYTAEGKPVGKSQRCARKGISQVVFARIVMAAPGMVCVPFMMEAMQKTNPWFRNTPAAHLPFQTAAVGMFLLLMVPFACAIYPQEASYKYKNLEKRVKTEYESKLGMRGRIPEYVYFNKGL